METFVQKKRFFFQLIYQEKLLGIHLGLDISYVLLQLP